MLRKSFLVGVICLIILLGIFIGYKVLFSTKLLFTITNTSCNCVPNTVYFYSNNTYVTRGSNNIVVEEGIYSYDVSFFINNLKENYEYDNENGMNYLVVLKDGSEFFVSHYDDNLNAFLSSLDITWY